MPTLSVSRPPKYEPTRQKFEVGATKGWREPTVAPGKAQHYGIEVNSGLVWQRWEAGKEYTKHIVLKNVKVKTEKIKYQ